ncbi:hypothetical protein PtrSN002B_003802 [Pyrenophora tritici-repentis]|nr:uncharacterized protein PTRG_11115 [Pyrenophora tritici-repentis Pt-1C-BFP]KAA8622245.1 F-box-like-2 domain-containing protein [Pyrenophora tritici-repentis]EDU44165.1 predicted protein [Pyrenophora tritici-repentis Pt-1C-BFP]KAF7451225.1 hypothetical protein A1F99_030020 [Pyrenophora tritici-repentis]KAI0576583.1 F-box-like-2 domain-containing protein [Pyrenophora tritici-repentis]KAI0592187.1 F-box-like-2 domain-containing protein [Pyrenophora tritici-repentis]
MTAGTKRKVDTTTVSRKRQKTIQHRQRRGNVQQTRIHRDAVPEAEELDVVAQNHVFRFMDLPGELRNRIYEFAIETSQRTFPLTHLKPKKTRGKKPEDPRPSVRPLPYIGLTQVCTTIRKEFRPLWLSTHRFPLFVLDDYLKVFFPTPLRASQASDEVRKRIKSYYNPAGTLRLNLDHSSKEEMDIHKLLLFQLRFPDYTLTPTAWSGLSGPPNAAMLVVSAVLNNKTPKWILWLKRRVITQVRLGVNHMTMYIWHVRITVKASHFPGWKQSCYGVVKDHDEFIEGLGLGGLGCDVRLGVVY